MKYILVLIGAVILTSLMPPPQQEKQITVTLTLAQWNTTLKGLTALPYTESAEIIQSIQGQAQRQLQPTPVKDSTTKKH